jgi:hypothetical protein
VVEILASMLYTNMEEVLNVVHAACKILSVTACSIMSQVASVQESAEQGDAPNPVQIGEEEIRTAGVVQCCMGLLAILKDCLQRVYHISERYFGALSLLHFAPAIYER